MDELADAARPGPARAPPRQRAPRRRSTTATGQVLAASAGLAGLPRGAPAALATGSATEAAAAQRGGRRRGPRRGVGIGAMWYGIGNTSIANPSTIEMGVDARRPRRPVLRRGRHRPGRLDRARPDRGRRARRARRRRRARQRRHRPHGRRRQVVGLAPDLRLGQRGAPRGRGPPAPDPAARARSATDATHRARAQGGIVVDRRRRPVDDRSSSPSCRRSPVTDATTECVLAGRGTFDPDTTPLDADGQGVPVPDLRLRGADRGGRGRPRARDRQGPPDRGGPRRRAGDQPDPGRGPDPRRHRPGPRASR